MIPTPNTNIRVPTTKTWNNAFCVVLSSDKKVAIRYQRECISSLVLSLMSILGTNIQRLVRANQDTWPTQIATSGIMLKSNRRSTTRWTSSADSVATTHLLQYYSPERIQLCSGVTKREKPLIVAFVFLVVHNQHLFGLYVEEIILNLVGHWNGIDNPFNPVIETPQEDDFIPEPNSNNQY